MNAPLPKHTHTALETVTLDDNPLCGLSRRHKDAAIGKAECSGFGVEQACEGGAL